MIKSVRIHGITVLWLCYTLPLFATQPKISVAVLPLEVHGIQEDITITLTDRLRSELLQTNAFDVMERERMEEILAEQGFQQSGACRDEECVVEAGRLLGISHMVAGSLGAIGSMFTLTLRLIDVETGRILLTATDDIPGPIENVLGSFATTAGKLAALSSTLGDQIISYGTLQFKSDPPGALIIIDDRALSAVTPTTIDSIRTGVHVIRMQKGLFTASQAVFVTPNQVQPVTLTLSMAKGGLKIISSPSDATIFLDQVKIGSTPYEMPQTPVGAYSLRIRKKGFTDYERIITIKENETTIVSATLTPLAFITIHTTPTDCRIAVDDSIVGRAPIDSLDIPPGFHKLTVSREGYVAFDTTRFFNTGRHHELEITIRPEAILSLQTTPSGATVLIDGKERGKTPLEIRGLPGGVVNLQLSLQQYVDHSEQITLISGQHVRHYVTLNKKQGKLIVESVPSAARVEIDGDSVGITPMRLEKVTFGEHIIRVSKPGYTPYEERLTVSDELPKTIRVPFSIARGTLFLHPMPKDATILMDGKRLKNLPENGLQLLPGEYYIQAHRIGYEPFKAKAQIAPSKATSLAIQMTPKTRFRAALRSLVLPGWGQYYSDKHSRKMLFAFSEIVALSGVLTNHLLYESKLNEFHEALRDYQQAFDITTIETARRRIESSHKSLTHYHKLRSQWTTASIIIWAFNIAEASIFPPIRPAYVRNGYGATLSFQF